MLDTNAASSLLKGQPDVVARLKAEAAERICLSVVTEAELLYGCRQAAGSEKTPRRGGRVLGGDRGSALEQRNRAATIRAELERRGRPLGTLDTMIAAHAVEHDAVLVSDDRAFGAIPGLRLEDWTAA